MALLESINIRSDEEREAIAEMLNACLANLIALHDVAKVAHWNVRGPAFGPLHALFEDLASGVSGHADKAAERVAMLGARAIGKPADVAAMATLTEYPDVTDGLDHARELVTRIRECVGCLNAARVTADEMQAVDAFDLLTDIIRGLEENYGWKLLAHIQ